MRELILGKYFECEKPTACGACETNFEPGTKLRKVIAIDKSGNFKTYNGTSICSTCEKLIERAEDIKKV